MRVPIIKGEQKAHGLLQRKMEVNRSQILQLSKSSSRVNNGIVRNRFRPYLGELSWVGKEKPTSRLVHQ